MNRYKILDIIFALASKNGSYYRVWQELRRDDDLLFYLEKQDFSNVAELVEFLEYNF